MIKHFKYFNNIKIFKIITFHPIIIFGKINTDLMILLVAGEYLGINPNTPRFINPLASKSQEYLICDFFLDYLSI